MNPCINRWMMRHPKLQQWMWFVGLWCAGLGTTLLLAYPIKLLIRQMS